MSLSRCSFSPLSLSLSLSLSLFLSHLPSFLWERLKFALGLSFYCRLFSQSRFLHSLLSLIRSSVASSFVLSACPSILSLQFCSGMVSPTLSLSLSLSLSRSLSTQWVNRLEIQKGHAGKEKRKQHTRNDADQLVPWLVRRLPLLIWLRQLGSFWPTMVNVKRRISYLFNPVTRYDGRSHSFVNPLVSDVDHSLKSKKSRIKRKRESLIAFGEPLAVVKWIKYPNKRELK